MPGKVYVLCDRVHDMQSCFVRVSDLLKLIACNLSEVVISYFFSKAVLLHSGSVETLSVETHYRDGNY
jgi:hypothetical protein